MDGQAVGEGAPRLPADDPHRPLSGGVSASGQLALPDRLFPRLAPGIEWGLGRTEAVLADAGEPHRAYPSIHVGGTNGKGTVAALVASVLHAHGLRTGLYTSPHVREFRERYRVGEKEVEDDRLLEVAESLRTGVEEHGLTAFEAATVLAFRLFALEGVDVAVIEVGLGGRLDATNVVVPEVAVITNVSRDHAGYLGDTLPAIATEKAGIMKRGVPLVTAETDPGCLEVFRRRARETEAELVLVDPVREPSEVRTGLGGTTFGVETGPWGRLTLETPLVGRHQATNGVVAVRALERLPPALRPSAAAVREGFRRVRWPGRLQVERGGDGPWVLDVAHNTAGVETLAEALEELDLPEPLVLVVGILGDKEWGEMLPPLLRLAASAVLTTPDSVPRERSWDPAAALEALRETAARSGSGPGGRPWGCRVEVVSPLARALERARRLAGAGTVVVTGSHHTVGEALGRLSALPDAPGLS